MSRRIVVLLEGESLVNDASGLVLFRFAVAAALTGTFNPQAAAVEFVVLAGGGVLAGMVFGMATISVLSRLRDPTLASLGSLLAAWAAYILGEAVGVSGVLATVACGLVIGSRQHRMVSAAARTSSAAVWRTVVFVLESLVFILIGLQFRGVLLRLGSWAASATLLPDAAATIAAVALSRFATAGALADSRIVHFRTILAAVQAGRAEALRLYRTGEIHERVLYALEDELDLEELAA